MRLNGIIIVGMALALVTVAVPAATGEESGVEVRITESVGSLSFDDLVDGPVSRVLVSAANTGPDTLILVTIFTPTNLAKLQEPAPAGWIASWSDRTIQFQGSFVQNSGNFVVRLVGAVPPDPFRVEINTLGASGSRLLALEVPVTPAVDAADFACQIVPVVGAGGSSTVSPFGVISTKAPTSAEMRVAVFDGTHHEYLDPAGLSGTVTLTHVSGAPSVTFPLAPGGQLDIVDTVASDPVVVGLAGMSVLRATLWNDAAGMTALASKGGAWNVLATVDHEGQPACTEYMSLGGILSPQQDTTVVPFAIVPADLDSDLDGHTNVNEVRSNSNPLNALSTPFTDDDADGTANANDPLTLPKL